MSKLRIMAGLFYHYVPPVVTCCVIGPLVWMLLDNTSPVEVFSARPLRPAVPRDGGLVVEYDMLYRRMCEGDAQRIFVDSARTLIPINIDRIRAGYGRDGRRLDLKREKARLSIQVPHGAAPGPATYQSITEFYCNPLQRILHWGIVTKFPPVRFEVLDAYAPKPTAPTWEFGPFPDPPSGDAPLKGVMPPLPDKPMDKSFANDP